jgi:hypothetical protein
MLQEGLGFSEQFFFVPEDMYDGVAAIIMRPAS